MIPVCMGYPGAGKSIHLLLKITEELKRGREVFLSLDDSYSEPSSNLVGYHQALHHLDRQQSHEFWQHIQPGSFVVIDDVHSLLPRMRRDAFFKCWYSDHLRAGTDLVFACQNVLPLATFFHHYPGDPLLHKSVNVDNLLYINSYRLFSLKYYTVKGAVVDNSYLNQPHFDRQPGFRLSRFYFQDFYLTNSTVQKISKFFGKEVSK